MHKISKEIVKFAHLFSKKVTYLYLLEAEVILPVRCNCDLSSKIPETRENWQLCQIIQQKLLLLLLLLIVSGLNGPEFPFCGGWDQNVRVLKLKRTISYLHLDLAKHS